MDPGEDPGATVARELFEETGLKAQQITPIAWTNDLFPEDALHYITLHHLVEVDGEPQVREPEKAAEWVWWTDLEQLPSPLFGPAAALWATGWRPRIQGPGIGGWVVIKIELAELSDLAHVLRLRHDGFSVHAPRAYTAKEVQNLLDDVDPDELKTMIEHQQLFVAKKEGRVVGCAAGRAPTFAMSTSIRPRLAKELGQGLSVTWKAIFTSAPGALALRPG